MSFNVLQRIKRMEPRLETRFLKHFPAGQLYSKSFHRKLIKLDSQLEFDMYSYEVIRSLHDVKTDMQKESFFALAGTFGVAISMRYASSGDGGISQGMFCKTGSRGRIQFRHWDPIVAVERITTYYAGIDCNPDVWYTLDFETKQPVAVLSHTLTEWDTFYEKI